MTEWFLSWRSEERRAIRRAAAQLQRRADYPYCREGLLRCLDQTCPCVDGPIGRARFRAAVRERIRRAGRVATGRQSLFNEPEYKITCPLCGATSHHPLDVAERYCGRCHVFWGDLLDEAKRRRP